MVGKEQKKILVTGGAGFIGSNFIRYLYNKYPNYAIYNFDLLTYAGNPENIADIEKAESSKKLKNRRYFFIKGDICDPKLVAKIFKKYDFDVVVNFAAESHVDRSILDDYYFIRTNLLGTHNLIGWVKKCGIKKFVHISTDEIYGDVLTGSSSEHHAMRPSNPYAASKAAADLLVQSYMRTHKLPMLIVRGSNNFGPYQYPEKLIPLTITNVLAGKKIPIHGNGLQKRRWIHVEDFCSAIDLVMHRGKEFGIYNVAGLEMTNIDIVQKICEVLGKDPKQFMYTAPDRPGGDLRYAPDSRKIKTELGWSLKLPIRYSLKPVVQWYLENQDWWRRVRNKKEFKVYYNKQYKSEY